MKNSRLVYSTDRGRVCPKCGWPENDCKCTRLRPTNFAVGATARQGVSGRDAPVPDRVVAKLRLEKAGRGGKTVTVVYDLPRNPQFLKDLCAELKRACGTGGTVSDDTVELQGDHPPFALTRFGEASRDRVREVLQKKAFVVKGA